MRDDVLLQLSDLHFGSDRTMLHGVDRDAVLRSLVESLDALEADWRPSIVACTGDTGWSGKRPDYESAKVWFQSVAAVLALPPSSFLFVPGNHDGDRALARKLARAADHEEADRIFEDGVPEHYQKPFEAYAEFCRTFGAAPYSFRGASSYLIGAATVGRIRFAGVNTCWFSQGNDDRNKLRLSLALMKQLEASLLRPGRWDDRPVTVALMHHPESWLHHEETGDWGVHGHGAYLFLGSRAHLLLYGHTHEAPRPHGRVSGGGIKLGCGASFAGAGHPNTYQLVRFCSDHIEYRNFQLENPSFRRAWRSSDVSSATYSDAARTTDTQRGEPAKILLQELRKKLAAFASSYIDEKSRALTPEALPKLHPLHVEVRVHRAAGEPRSTAESFERLSLEQAVADATRLLIWGDLGAGKSTLVGMFTEQANRDGDATVVLVPAGALLPAPATGLELLNRVSGFVHASLFPEREGFDLRKELLAGADETVIVVDGLDEIDNKSARRILSALGALPSSFPRLRVVATSREVGNEYGLGSEWSAATTATLLDDERLALLTSIAAASGLSTKEAETEAKSVLGRIRADAVLEEAARSPMALRLLHQELRRAAARRDRSLGEMLYRLLVQRLQWEEADTAKRCLTTALCEALPSAEARLALLSTLAHGMIGEGTLSVERARAILRSAPVLRAAPEPAKAQALSFLEWTNLVRVANDRVDFALRPLFEVACAPFVLEQLGRGDPIPHRHWRMVAFAAAIARGRGQLEKLRPALLDYVRAHREVGGWILPACYIVAESRDGALAKDVVSWRSTRPFERPILTLAAERRTSAVAVAMTIHLAGDEGFEWFYRTYLDPRYPIPHRGSGILENIFEYWILLQGDSLSPRQTELLSTFPRSHLDTDSPARLRLVPLAVLACPTSVASHERARLLPRLLTHSSLSSRAEAALRRLQQEHPREAQAALWEHVLARHENAAKSAELWLEAASSELLPPPEIISVAFRARGNWDGRFFSRRLWDVLVERLGEAKWERFCRWQLSEQDAHDAIGAALPLIDRSPELARDLRDVLLWVLHDGDRTAEAETILARLADSDPIDTARWLSRRIAEHQQPMDHAPASWWRLLLSLLPRLEADGPACLAVTIGGVGPYLLSRHADIRRLVRQFRRSSRGDAYVKMLEEKLRRGTAAQRFGAAQFLVCLEASLGEALLVCARARLDHLNESWEWDRYCLSLHFPAAAIDHVLAKKGSLVGEAKLFVLALAAADGRRLDDADLSFVAESAGMLYTVPALDAVLSEEPVFRRLLHLLGVSDLRVATSAAEALLQRHHLRLQPDVHLRCEILAAKRDSLAYEQRFRELEADPSGRARVIECGRELANKYGQMLILPALAEASADPTKWVDVLWALFGKIILSQDANQAGWGLLALGKELPHHGTAIGAAARKLCDERTPTLAGGSIDVTPWLPLLAHEFGAVQTQELLDFVNPYYRQPLHSSVLAALAARAPSPTLAAAPRREPPPEVVAASLDEVADADRDADGLTENLCHVIVRTLYRDLVPADLERLAGRGARLRLIAGILQHLHGLEIEPSWILKIIGSDLFRWSRDNACHMRLRKLAHQVFRRLVHEQPDRSRDLLREEIERGGADCLNMGMLVATAGWTISPSELPILLASYSEHPFRHWRPLLRYMMTESMSVFDRKLVCDVMRQSIAHSLERLVLAQGYVSERDPLALVVYASLAWLIGAESPEAPVAFRRGLAELSVEGKNQGGFDVLAEAAELLERVDPQRIRDALTSYQDDEPAVAAVARLLASFIHPAARSAP